ncbi:GNAT family N-acetyltransferase [Pseudoxanthomonas sp. Root630]|uniref:GNAT family N-acetyltransferase n=1 Tax=Pseudoxanthomonas sp. Root630 TaxID=1736574 RepID=UPI0009D69322|nr:GNAT family N-acetyltransferase [Pseudoxanthomonas sp. Root630]
MQRSVESGTPAARYDVRVERLPDMEVLEARWRSLEARSRGSFFQSWTWIGTWLRTLCPRARARLLTVSQHGEPIALGVVVEQRRGFALGLKHVRLHEVGDRTLDSITIEFNGLLSVDGREHDALAACITHFDQHERHWLTFYLPGIDMDDIPLERLRSPRLRLQVKRSPSPYVDLAGLRHDGNDYVTAVPGSRTRAHLRRTARRLIETCGPLACAVATGTEERLAFFDALVHLHQAHWDEDAGEQGAFGDPRIVAFHRALIQASSPEAGVHLMRLEAGDIVVGYLYHLVWRGTAYFYQAGIDYRRIGRTGSPGLLLVTTAINEFLGNGFDRYELMAGQAEYKRSLASAEGSMVWLSVDRVGWRARIVDLYRRRRDRDAAP